MTDSNKPRMTEEQIDEMNSYTWWHRINLGDGIVTPGSCPHGTGEDIETRFGLPKDMAGLSVLDVGSYDGLFAFEAEKRGADQVYAIDVYQKRIKLKETLHTANAPFQFAKKMLKSNVLFRFNKLEEIRAMFSNGYDYIFHFGIMYHIKNPLSHVEKLMDLVAPNGTILLETAISNSTSVPSLEYRPDFDNDSTNFYYPNKEWVELAFLKNGAKSVECFYNDGIRATFRIKA